MSNLTESKILKLRPTFKFGGMTMVDWFEITKGGSFYSIRSGLNHADGKTKSPYYYCDCIGGEDTKNRALEKFNKWWKKVNKK